MKENKKVKISAILLTALLSICLFFGIGFSGEQNVAFAATTPKYLALGSVNYVANLPYNAGYNKTMDYTATCNLVDYFTVHIYSNSYSGESTLSQNTVLPFSYVNIVANVKKTTSPHNTNYPFAHQSYSLKNNDTGATVASGALSGTGERTLVSRTLSDGYYTLSYTAGGTRSGIGAGTITDYFTYSFYVDANPPSYSLKAGGATVASGSYTNSLITYSASDTRFSRIYYKKPSSSIYSSTTATSYSVSATAANNGWWYFYATDTVGNTSAVVSIYLDTEKPVGKISSSGATISSGSYTNKAFSYSATDSGGVKTLQYKTPLSSSWVTYSGATIATTATNGWYYFRATDNAGYVSTEQSVYLDTSKPTGTLYAGANVITSGTTTNADYIKFTPYDSGSGIKTVYVKEPNASSYTVGVSGSQYVVSGTYYFYASDNAGNDSNVYSVTLDRSAPTLTCTGASFGTITNKGFTVTATDSGGTATLYYKYENETWKASGNSYTVPVTAKEGKYYFYAVDNLGNTTGTSWVILSTAAPTGRIVKSDTDNSVYFTWTYPYWTATLDGKNYNKDVWINEEGKHTIVRSNALGQSATYNFTIEHSYIAKETVPPTCTEQGFTRYECSECGDSYSADFTQAVGHSYIKTETAATCTESGKRIYSCQVCGYEFTENTESPTGHSYVSTIMKEANCTKNGARFHVCEKCEDSYTSEIPSRGHSYEITDVKNENGSTQRTYACSVCGDSYTQDLGNQYEHVSSYVEHLFDLYVPYMWWVLLGTTGVWSIAIGIAIIIAKKNEDKEKARKMLVNYVIGLVIIAAIVVACPYLIKGIAALISS